MAQKHKEYHCTHDQCAAVVYGTLPKVWMRRGKDLLCPQHAEQAVWFSVATGCDPERGVEVTIEYMGMSPLNAASIHGAS